MSRLVKHGFVLLSRVVPRRCWLKGLSAGSVVADIEQIAETFSGTGVVGEQPAGSGPALVPVVIEQHGLFDACQAGYSKPLNGNQ